MPCSSLNISRFNYNNYHSYIVITDYTSTQDKLLNKCWLEKKMKKQNESNFFLS